MSEKTEIIPFEPDAVSTAEGKSGGNSIAQAMTCSIQAFLSTQRLTGMEITVNQQEHQVPDNYSVEELLAFLMPETEKGIAVAINQQIIPKTSWPTHLLNPADSVMLIRATQGG